MGIIRLLLALSVVISHSTAIFGFKLVGGPVAVQSFFMISGFYMALVINEKYFTPALSFKTSYKLFITNRFLKLYPVYWVVLILTIGVSYYLYTSSKGTELARIGSYMQFSGSLQPGTWAFIIFTNLTIFFQDLVLFLGFDPASGSLYFTPDFKSSNPAVHSFLFVPQAWSVGIELVFYVLAPFIIRKGLKLILPILVISFIARLVFYINGFNYDPWTSRFLPFELGFFLLGAVAYYMYKTLKKNAPAKGLSVISWLLVMACIGVYGFINHPIKIYVFYTVFFGALPFVFQLTKNSKLDRFLGDLSYPVYISHLFVLLVLIQLRISSFYYLGLYLSAFTLMFSILLQWLCITPIEKYRQKRIHKK
jgi:peptidoglycan/LPS O-acetylase OafA/YrhL